MYLVEKDTRYNYSSRTPSGRANIGLSAYIIPNLAIVTQIILLLQHDARDSHGCEIAFPPWELLIRLLLDSVTFTA